MSSEAASGQTASVLDTTSSNAAGWPETYAGMAWFNAAFADIDERHRYDGNFLTALRGAGKKVSIELGAFYLDEFCDASRRNDPAFFYDTNFQKPRFAEYGDSLEGSQLQNSPVFGQVDYVIIDDPFLRAYDRRSFPYGAACASQPFAFDFEFFKSEVVKYMQLIKVRLPHVKFVLSTSTAHWNYTSPARSYYPSLTGHGDSINLPGGANLDFKDVLDSLIPAAAAGGVPFDGMIVDYPYNYVTQAISGQVPTGTPLSSGSAEYANRWGRLTGLVTDAHNRGLKAYLFANSEQVPATSSDEVRSSQKFHDETNSYIADIVSKGVPLDMALVESWYYNFGTGGIPTAPRALLPETDAYTFTNTARDVLRQIQAYNEPVFGVTGNVEGIASGNLVGWACGKYNASSIPVHLFIGTAAGPVTFSGAYTANLVSEPAIAAICNSNGTNNRFSIPVAGRFPAGTYLYVYGLSPIGGRTKLLAPGTPMP